MTPELFWTTTLAHGGVLSVAMAALILWSLRISAEAWLGDYPPDIRERYGEISAKGKRLRLLFGVPILLAPLGVAAALVFRLHDLAGAALSFRQAALAIFICWSVFNVVDLVLVDWLIFVRFQPRFIVLPGTEGLPGYKDYFFHFKAFLVGVVLSAAVALAAAAGYRWLVS